MDKILIFAYAIFIWYIWLKTFKKINFLDRPGPDVPTRKPVPNAQWVFLIIWFLSSLIIFFPQYISNPQIIWLIIWSLILWITEFIDNFININAKIRILIQLWVITILFYLWYIWFSTFTLPWWVIVEFHWLASFILTMIWFLWFINAINWFDWVYWLASWVSSIWFLTVFLLLKIVVFWYYTWISPENYANLNMIADISFLLFIFSAVYCFIEFKPLWVLRDVWVMFLGFSLAYLSLLGWAKIWTILVVLSLPIFDSIWVFVNRVIIMKKNPLKWDYTHLHHRLLALWWNRSEIRTFIWSWSIFFMTIMILQWANRFNKLIIFILMAIIFFWANIYLFWIKKLPWEYKVVKDGKKLEKGYN